ncbi:unnamed protein product [Durusdinium trenchii]|uniref:Glycosyltransferase 61 catalytic domain-containing protein n=1 Tax=Durusdinium trenchii TaxID=1381693 RepID=A0ABP0R7R0_9DINO
MHKKPIQAMQLLESMRLSMPDVTAMQRMSQMQGGGSFTLPKGPEEVVRTLCQVAPDAGRPPPEVVGAALKAAGLPATDENLEKALREAKGCAPSSEDMIAARMAAEHYGAQPSGFGTSSSSIPPTAGSGYCAAVGSTSRPSSGPKPEDVIQALLQAAPGLGQPPPEVVGMALRQAGVSVNEDTARRALAASGDRTPSQHAIRMVLAAGCLYKTILLSEELNCRCSGGPTDAAVGDFTKEEWLAGAALARLVNGSGHLHWRFARTGWLVGSMSLEHMDEALLEFAQSGWIPPAGILFWHGLCRKVLMQSMSFYRAWAKLLEADGRNQNAYIKAILQAGLALTTYFLAKDPKEPTYEQERQVAMLQRSVIAANSGSASNPCTCQLFYQSMLRQAVNFWKSSFKPQHVRQGPSGDEHHDAALELLVQRVSPCTILEEHSWSLFVPPDEALLLPQDDPLSGVFACLPKRIITLTVCGQYWLYKHDAPKARQYFFEASKMLIFSMDCFDGALHTFDERKENTHLLTVPELFAYLGRVDPKASPYVGWTGEMKVSSGKWPPDVGQQRSLTPSLSQNAATFPPLCFGVNGTLHLRVEGLSGKKLHLYDFTGTWSLLPAFPLASLASPMKFLGTRAVLIFVDNPSWTTLGHCIHHLTAVAYATLGLALAHGGVEEMLKLRKTLQLYLYFPRKGLLDAGFQVNHFNQVQSVMLPWLQMLSDQPPVLMSDLPDSINSSALPRPLQVAGRQIVCHQGGFWTSRHSRLKAEELEAFVQVASSFPWPGRSEEEVLHDVWGHDGFDPLADPCVRRQARCVRVLIVRRGQAAHGRRSLVNLADALTWISQTYPANEVRVATIEMEKLSLGEEIAVAKLADIFIGSYGSGMWWPIFMAPNSCVVWLTPHVHMWFLEQRSIDLSTPHWSNSGSLEYENLRPLRHVVVRGALPPEGTLGHFQLSLDEERSNHLAFQTLDIFLDLPKFGIAFSEAVAKCLFRSCVPLGAG